MGLGQGWARIGEGIKTSKDNWGYNSTWIISKDVKKSFRLKVRMKKVAMKCKQNYLDSDWVTQFTYLPPKGVIKMEG